MNNIPNDALQAAKEAMREVTPPAGASKADWLAKYGEWSLIAGAVAAALEAAAPHMLAGVVALADGWEADGEEIMALSKRTPDEREATMCLMEGATMVENARHVRNALGITP